MAIHTADNQSESNLHKPQPNLHHHHHHHQNQNMDDDSTVSETVNTLKSLNTLLLKETKQNREKLDSLIQFNTDLNSELTQSVMANDSLKSEMNTLTEKSTMLEIERGVMVDFITVQVNKMVENLERILNENERLMREKEFEISGLNRRLDEERGVVTSVSNERDEIRARLDAKTREVGELEGKVRMVEEEEVRVLKEVGELKVKCDGLIAENVANERMIEFVTKEKEDAKMSLVEANGVVDELKMDVEKLVEEKKAIADEKSVLDGKNTELQTSVDELKKLVESMRVEEGALLEKYTVLEKKYAAGLKNEEEMKNEISKLIDEKKETEGRIEYLANEKSLVAKDLEDAMKELQAQKVAFEQIVQEKTELENVKIERESEIAKKDEQLSAFKDMISSLEVSSGKQIERVKELEVEAGSYKSSFDQAAIERDEALKQLTDQKGVTDDFKQKFTGMEKEMGDLHEKLATLTAEKVKQLGEKNRLEDQCAGLVKEVADLEARFAESRTEFDSKLNAAEANLNRVLNILKKTVSVCDGNSDFDQENGVEERIKEHVAGIEAIKKAFKDKERSLEEMKMQVELVESSAKKEKGFWTMVSSATTLLAAAASIAFVARAH